MIENNLFNGCVNSLKIEFGLSSVRMKETSLNFCTYRECDVNARTCISPQKSRFAGYLGIGQFNRLGSHRGIPVGMQRVRSSTFIVKSGDAYRASSPHESLYVVVDKRRKQKLRCAG